MPVGTGTVVGLEPREILRQISSQRVRTLPIDPQSEVGKKIEPQASPYLELVWEAAGIQTFLMLFQPGVLLRARLGTSVREILCRQLGVSDEYLDNRLNTVLLDAKPVDDVDSAIVKEGSVLALSASMPGFAGAALRKAGHYAPMRYSITHAEEKSALEASDGYFTVKLFNMTIREIGPLLLGIGGWIRAQALDDFLASRSANFWAGCIRVLLDGQRVSGSELKQKRWAEESALVKVRVTCEEEA
jgi:hypothetical protein